MHKVLPFSPEVQTSQEEAETGLLHRLKPQGLAMTSVCSWGKWCASKRHNPTYDHAQT